MFNIRLTILLSVFYSNLFPPLLSNFMYFHVKIDCRNLLPYARHTHEMGFRMHTNSLKYIVSLVLQRSEDYINRL